MVMESLMVIPRKNKIILILLHIIACVRNAVLAMSFLANPVKNEKE